MNETKTKNFKIAFKIISIIVVSYLLYIIAGNIKKTEYLFLYKPIRIFYLTAIVFTVLLQIIKLPFLISISKYIKNILFTISFLFILSLIFLITWYNYCFFPNDQEYLEETAISVDYRGDHLEEVKVDLIRDIKNIKFSNPLSKNDYNYLIDEKRKKDNFYIDINPYYNKRNFNNLKYATGKIFHYTYQKNSIVLKSNSRIIYNISGTPGEGRFLEFYAAIPNIHFTDPECEINIYYTADSRKKILFENIKPEVKSSIEPFRFSNVIKSIMFYLQHPGRTVLPDSAGWTKINTKIPNNTGKLEIEFKSSSNKEFLFIGSPRIYKIFKRKRNRHLNVIYLIFDTLAKEHIDLYEYYDTFSKMPYDKAQNLLGARKIVSPYLNKYFDRSILFDNVYTAGHVTRPSIVSLWTSQPYTRSRLPVFRNIVTHENEKEFHDLNFASLANELSRHGYFTKQISCNAQGHGVSGVGVDLGFDENYDYTMEAVELTENFRRIIEFANDNQNRKFFLYAHINTPHSPRWIPMSYFLSAYPDSNFYVPTSISLGNVRYINDSMTKVMNTIEKLKLLDNTLIIITSDHAMSPSHLFRGFKSKFSKNRKARESHAVATFHSRAVYARKGGTTLNNDIVNIPFLCIIPDNMKFKPGKVKTPVSSIDISPTLLDLTLGKTNRKFSGNSLKNHFAIKSERDSTNDNLLHLVGRFQRGFVAEGRFKYWINVPGLYKYKTKKNKKYIMHQEYLYDLKNDPYEIRNLAFNHKKTKLLTKMRGLYLNEYIDYDDKSFIYISPSLKNITNNYRIYISSSDGQIIYPKLYGKDVVFKYKSSNKLQFNARIKDKSTLISFETKPSYSKLTISIYKNDKLISAKNVFTSEEMINLFDNPIKLNSKEDCYIARRYTKTGLEPVNIPSESISYYRIPVNYWLEMSRSQKDINLSPGMKEVLRGWGYIQ